MTRVTIVVNHLSAPSEPFQRDLARILADVGHAVTFHALWPGGALDEPGVTTTVGVPPIGVRGVPIALARLARGSDRGMALAARRARGRFGVTKRALGAALQAGPILDSRPEVVHLGFSGIGATSSDALDLLDDASLVVSCRGTDELVQPLLHPRRARALGALLRRADRVHVVADAVGDAVRELGADPDSVRTIRPAVDTQRWDPRPPVEPAPDGPRTLVAVGRLAPAKGLDDLLAAVAVLRDGGDLVRLVVVGDGRHRDPLRLRVARTGLDEVVELPGALGPDAIADLLARADLYVCPSLSEGISNGVLEAMARSVPVVSTSVGGMPEVIRDGHDGWLVAPGRPDLLAATIGAALRSGRLDEVGRAGRARIEAAFDRPRLVREWEAFYADLPVLAGSTASRNVRRREGGD